MRTNLRIIQATPAAADLPAVNAVVEAALMTWDLPERVRRLVLPSYRYDTLDLGHLQFALACRAADDLVGVAAWEAADRRDCPSGRRGLLLHGLYVHPTAQQCGIGSRLLQGALGAAADGGFDGLLVRAQRDAEGFFERRGFHRLAVTDTERDYAGRYWRAASSGSAVTIRATT